MQVVSLAVVLTGILSNVNFSTFFFLKKYQLNHQLFWTVSKNKHTWK